VTVAIVVMTVAVAGGRRRARVRAFHALELPTPRFIDRGGVAPIRIIKFLDPRQIRGAHVPNRAIWRIAKHEVAGVGGWFVR
jgi:hypothetical protein